MDTYDLGHTLRTAREQRDLSLNDIARDTKIPLHLLQFIERSELETLPGGVLMRGYLRAFSAAVGVDGERLVREFSAAHPDPDPLDELRARFSFAEGPPIPGVTYMLAIASLVCLLYVLHFTLQVPFLG